MNGLCDLIGQLLGLGVDPKDLTILHICLRAVIVFASTVVMIRLSSKRSLAEKTAFDATVIVIIASVLARAINGSAPFFPTIAVGFLLVALHRILAAAAYHSHRVGCLIKGRPVTIIENGQLQRDNMRHNHISDHDLEEDMRLDAHTEDISKIKTARLERSGDISFIKNA